MYTRFATFGTVTEIISVASSNRPIRDRRGALASKRGVCAAVGRLRHRLRAVEKSAGDASSDPSVTIFGQRSSRPAIPQERRRVKFDYNLDGAEAQHAP
jgi:hypothetical protein